MIKELLEKLNEEQREAVTSTEGRIKCDSGAGTGKTRVLTHRFAYLVEEVGILPSTILCLTFTNKAAQEMKTRIQSMLGSETELPFVCTIHSLCVKILRQEIFRMGWPSNFTIMDEADSKTLATKVLDDLGIDKDEKSAVGLLSEIGKFKANTEYYVRNYFEKESPYSLDPVKRFLQEQRKGYYLDFDDLVQVASYILKEFGVAIKNWSFFQYVMVDEAQDCNQTDWDIIDTLAKPSDNLFFVGDFSQSIYIWRGAKPRLFLKHMADKTIVINKNYRSTQPILDAANEITRHSISGDKKNLVSDRKEGKLPVVFHAEDDIQEGEWIASEIAKKINEENKKPHDFAILYRASFQSRHIEQALLKASIPYVVWGGVRFYDRKEVKDLLSYLRLIGSDDDISFMRIVNVPSRKFGKVSMNKIKEIADNENLSLYTALKTHIGDKDFNKKPLIEFVDIIEKLRSLVGNLNISDILSQTLDVTGLRYSYESDADTDRIDNVKELIASVKEYEDANEEGVTIDKYLQDISLFTNLDKTKDSDTVKLMTMHQSKGLEFPVVYVIGMNENIFPNARTLKEDGDDGFTGELNLCYVAFTRAMDELYITESEGFNQVTRTDKVPSRFIYYIPYDKIIHVKKNGVEGGDKEKTDNLPKQNTLSKLKPLAFKYLKHDLFVGDKVMHNIFGEGIITEINHERLVYVVNFNGVQKTVIGRVLTKM